jgi:GNAT superfamily N-acetyltransferase
MVIAMSTLHTDQLPRFNLRLARNDAADGRLFRDLFNSLYVRRVDEDYYRWQFFSTPFPSKLVLAIGEDGTLVGCYGFHVIPGAQEDTRIAWALDIMVAPPYRGKGVFRSLAAFAAQQVIPYLPAALCVMANQRADRAHADGLGWSRVMTISNFVCQTSCAPTPPQDFKFHLHRDFDAGAVESIVALQATSRTSNLRSAKYLRWRFVKNPWYRYSLFLVSVRGQPFGYLVLKTFRNPQTDAASGDIVDVIWPQDHEHGLSAMLCFALGHFRDSGLSEASVWLQTNTMLDQVGKSLGFVESSQKRFFCAKILDERCRYLEEPARWFVTMSDAEIY